jgi:ADP-ribose pyrophosphatase YjhB (NUDIX family)
MHMARQESPPVMACGVIEQTRDGMREVLICRIPNEPYQWKWTFPGGPVERGEAPEAALRRALESLLGLKVEIRFGQPPFDLSWDDVLMRWRFFFCEGREEDVQNTHFAEIRWERVGSLREYEFDPVAQQVVDWLLEQRETS